MLQYRKHLIKWPFFIVLPLLIACTYNDGKHRPLIPKNKNSAAEMANTLFAFVGKKIAVTPKPSPDDSFDAVFEARYQVLQKVYGDYQGDTITFAVYDHYGTPAFERYDHALLFVSKGSNGWYHEKYQYFDVYLTADGNWASPYKERAYADTNQRGAVKPVPIVFPSQATYLLNEKTWEEGEVEYWFPAPYYRIEKDKAIPLYGNYVHDLFRLKKETVLTARGLFGDLKPDTFEVLDTKMAEIRPTHRMDKNDKRFERFWYPMRSWIKAGDTAQLKGVLLDSLLVVKSRWPPLIFCGTVTPNWLMIN